MCPFLSMPERPAEGLYDMDWAMVPVDVFEFDRSGGCLGVILGLDDDFEMSYFCPFQ